MINGVITGEITSGSLKERKITVKLGETPWLDKINTIKIDGNPAIKQGIYITKLEITFNADKKPVIHAEHVEEQEEHN